jgi:hypothetical protein
MTRPGRRGAGSTIGVAIPRRRSSSEGPPAPGRRVGEPSRRSALVHGPSGGCTDRLPEACRSLACKIHQAAMSSFPFRFRRNSFGRGNARVRERRGRSLRSIAPPCAPELGTMRLHPRIGRQRERPVQPGRTAREDGPRAAHRPMFERLEGRCLLATAPAVLFSSCANTTAFADFNGDVKLDLVEVDRAKSSIDVLFNTAQFGGPTTLTPRDVPALTGAFCPSHPGPEATRRSTALTLAPGLHAIPGLLRSASTPATDLQVSRFTRYPAW